MTRRLFQAVACSCALLIAACGGGGSSGGGSSVPPPPPPPPPNTLALTVDAGPTGLTSQGLAAANTLYATVTLCTPGSTTACQTIDHVQIDTQSVGLEILAEVLNGSVVPTAIHDPTTSLPVFECVTFADGYTWGSIVAVDVTIGGRTLADLPVHLIGDTAVSGTAPAGCVSGPPENSVSVFGANGLLGVGNWLQDCGPGCVTGIPTQYPPYYVCSNAGTASQSCTTTTLALANQLQNPVGALSRDNNGVKIVLPAVTAPGAASLSGTLYFGVGTQTNNALGSATVLTVDGSGYLTTTYGGTALTSSFIDSGSNGYFFTDSTIPVCPSTDVAAGWDCPAQSLAESGQIRGQNGLTATVNFTVDNAHTLFSEPTLLTAYPNLAGPNSAANGVSNSFDWGLPFFFGRTVYVLFENDTATGAAFAF